MARARTACCTLSSRAHAAAALFRSLRFFGARSQALAQVAPPPQEYYEPPLAQQYAQAQASPYASALPQLQAQLALSMQAAIFGAQQQQQQQAPFNPYNGGFPPYGHPTGGYY